MVEMVEDSNGVLVTQTNYVCPVCPWCGNQSVFKLPLTDVYRWREGQLAQDVFPYLWDDERETLISGLHPQCAEEFFQNLAGDDRDDWDA